MNQTNKILMTAFCPTKSKSSLNWGNESIQDGFNKVSFRSMLLNDCLNARYFLSKEISLRTILNQVSILASEALKFMIISSLEQPANGEIRNRLASLKELSIQLASVVDQLDLKARHKR